MSKARTLANLMSDNAELADGQISVAEVVGAAPLASPDFTGTLSLAGTDLTPDFAELNHVNGVTSAIQTQMDTKSPSASPTFTGTATVDILNVDEASILAIAKDISDTAVDVFVYDTSKDSDGGAWRKSTQHTSWYNEAASSTRSSRKEFPAVAVIVAESTQLTIYDGDDPDMPMWMVFNGTTNYGSYLGRTSGANVTSVQMLNGNLCVGRGNSGFGEALLKADFIKEFSVNYAVSGWLQLLPISGRNEDATSNVQLNYTGINAIINIAINDVAMTVLPNAPIDYATGLPVPTIAVATDGGVSVIKDDGSVVDISYVAHTKVGSIHFNSLNHLLFSVGEGNKQNVKVHKSLPTSDQSNSQAGYQSSQEDLQYGNESVTHDISVHHTTHSFSEIADGALGSNKNLVLIDKNNTDASYITNFITSDYNTGWQVGDIKLATLSDTDTANVTGAELVTNGTFASNTTGWTSTSNGTFTSSSGTGLLTNTQSGDCLLYTSDAADE